MKGGGQTYCHTYSNSLSNKKGNSLPAVRGINHKYIVVEWIYDISDCQDRESGHVQYTESFFPSGGGPGGWGCAIVAVPYVYYKQYGDTEILREMYPQMMHYFRYLEAYSENDLVVSDREGVWCMGDWCTPNQIDINSGNFDDEVLIPKPLVNTYFYVKSLRQVIEIERILGIEQNTELLRKRIEIKKKALIREYYDESTGNFANNEQGANAFAIDIGLGDRRTFTKMVEHYHMTGELDTGIFGTDIVIRLLFEKGEGALVYKLLTSQKGVSFYSQMQRGATTFPENWNGARSKCHPMFGAVSRQLVEYVLGIRRAENSCAYEYILIGPVLMDSILSAEGKIESPYSDVCVKYNERQLTVTVPNGITAYLKNGTRLRCGTTSIIL